MWNRIAKTKGVSLTGQANFYLLKEEETKKSNVTSLFDLKQFNLSTVVQIIKVSNELYPPQNK